MLFFARRRHLSCRMCSLATILDERPKHCSNELRESNRYLIPLFTCNQRLTLLIFKISPRHANSITYHRVRLAAKAKELTITPGRFEIYGGSEEAHISSRSERKRTATREDFELFQPESSLSGKSNQPGLTCNLSPTILKNISALNVAANAYEAGGKAGSWRVQLFEWDEESHCLCKKVVNQESNAAWFHGSFCTEQRRVSQILANSARQRLPTFWSL